MFFHFSRNREIPNGIAYLKPSGSIIKEIYSIGLPAIIAQALMSFMTYGLNIILGTIDESVVTAFGLYYKIQQFILFAAFGLRDAITPIISFNYGAKAKKRVNEGIRYGMIYTLSIMIIGLIVIEIFAAPLSSVFGLSGTTKRLCMTAMRIISLSFLFAGANIAFQGIFQALGGGIESLIISVCRQFLFVIPVAWGFSLIARQNHNMIWLVWLTFLIAEGISCAISLIFMRRIRRKRIETLGEYTHPISSFAFLYSSTVIPIVSHAFSRLRFNLFITLSTLAIRLSSLPRASPRTSLSRFIFSIISHIYSPSLPSLLRAITLSDNAPCVLSVESVFTKYFDSKYYLSYFAFHWCTLLYHLHTYFPVLHLLLI